MSGENQSRRLQQPLDKTHHLSFLPLLSLWQNFELNFLAFLVIANESTSWNFKRHLDISCAIIIIIFITFIPMAYLLCQALIWVYGVTLTLKWVNLSNNWTCKWKTGARRWLKFKTVWIQPSCLSFFRESTESLKLQNKFHIFCSPAASTQMLNFNYVAKFPSWNLWARVQQQHPKKIFVPPEGFQCFCSFAPGCCCTI